MDLSLKISANFEQAVKAFENLGQVSEETQKRFQKFAAGMATDHVENFIEKQKRLEAAMLAAGKGSEVVETQTRNYQREIQRLIDRGLTPESDEVKKLQGELVTLTEKTRDHEQAVKAQEQAVKGAQIALAAIGAAVAAAAGFAVKAAADVEDMAAGFEPMLGSAKAATELVKQIQKEAAATPFEINAIGDSVKALLPAFKGSTEEAMKAFRMIGDTAQGNAQKLSTITSAYNKAMLTGKTNMQILNQIAGAGVPIYDQLASSMGITVQELTQMSKEGELTAKDLTGAFQQMTSEGGIFFEGMDKAAYTFSGTMLGVKENIGIIAGTIGAELLPAAKNIAGAAYDATRSFMDWISEGDNLKKTLDIVTYAVAGLVAGLVAFLVVAKGAAVIQALAAAFRVLTAAIAANPIGAIAVVITAILIPALIALYKNWDTVQTYLQQGLARLEYAFKWFGSVMKESFIVAVNGIKIAFMSLVDIIQSKVLGGVAVLLDVMGKLPFVGEMFQAASASVRGFSEGLSASVEASREASRAAIQAARDEQDATQAALDTKLAAIDEAARARREDITRQQVENAAIEEEIAEAAVAAQEARDAAVDAVALEDLKTRLTALGQTENQAQAERLDQFTRFLTARLAAEDLDGQARIEYLQEQTALILDQMRLEEDEKQALQTASDDLQIQEEQRLSDAKLAIKREELAQMTGLFGALSDLSDAAGENNVAMAILTKATSAAQAAINSYLAFTQVLADPSFIGRPFSRATAATTVLAAGLAQQVKILKTPIPSAETGGSFTVPDTGRVDGRLMRINPGERVDVTPRGMTGETAYHFQFVFDSQVLYDVINRGARAGELYTLTLAGNL